MENEVTRTREEDERLARLLASAIVIDLRRFPSAEIRDIISLDVNSPPPGTDT